MGLQENSNRNSSLVKSFGVAFYGIYTAARTERNIKIHLVISTITLLFGWKLAISPVEWLFILTAISGTFTLEMVNSAIERTVDLITKERHPLAKQAKDIAAGAVLVYSLFSVIVGAVIFLPKMF
ncbi:diacylglycerol kinase family protein [Peribacillus saganii]|uniref:Diacylglycerol kinase family protein n=1 Tax=Peribacillus saganii TaxID=2303992 RepID=A0A372LV70_9BACI|nr:diacylglycerol kinase family protein [Peribacillus saganii]RFU71690.1 diacylglycerol kinase family protein [Peribacillus saganii]